MIDTKIGVNKRVIKIGVKDSKEVVKFKELLAKRDNLTIYKIKKYKKYKRKKM